MKTATQDTEKSVPKITIDQLKNYREILFRGKRLKDGKWVQGDLIHLVHENFNHSIILTISDKSKVTKGEFSIAFMPNEVNLVTPKTVGQFTELTDKNGVKIFEGDILKSDFGDGEPFSIRFGDFFDEWSETHFVGFYTYPELNAFGKTIQGNTDAYQVIGNIHDNPELIGKEVPNA